ncbi:MAG TPA: hypothetical protein VH558_04375 [Pseudolabrys sp.]|jgi:hypothetical protein
MLKARCLKAIVIGAALAFLPLPSVIRSVVAQDIDPRCKDIYDKVACTCAVRNGGHIIPPPAGVKREGLKLSPKEGSERTRTLDGGRVAFPKYFRREGLKIRRSHALEAYRACMSSFGRKS